MRLKVFRLTFLLLIISVTSSYAQGSFGISNVGAEFQVFPAGFIIGPRVEFALSERSRIHGRVFYEVARRQDFGEFDNEEGGGLGFGFGYQHFFKNKLKNFFLSGRVDLLFLDIDWTDINGPITTMGTTEITVVQPTGQAGYRLYLGDKKWFLDLTVSFGVEVNVVTRGPDVGEGGIFLGGITFGRNFLNK